LRSESDNLRKKILLIDDDPELGKLVGAILQSLDVTFYQAYSGPEGLKKSYEIHPDLIILDVMMPGMSGYDVCSRLREFSNCPILMLTAKVRESDMMLGFNAGVDDFLKKPFNINELLARVRALLRRTSQQNTVPAEFIQAYHDSYLDIDLNNQTVHVNGGIVELSPREFSLLAYLVREQGKVVSVRELVREAWGASTPLGSSNPSLYVFYIRKKIKDGQFGHEYIRTFWGRGYLFEPHQSLEKK
jgi:DNA-binding response OmpR family regulator